MKYNTAKAGKQEVEPVLSEDRRADLRKCLGRLSQSLYFPMEGEHTAYLRECMGEKEGGQSKSWSDSKDVNHLACKDPFLPLDVVKWEPTSLSFAFSLRPATV